MKSMVIVANCQAGALSRTLAEVMPDWAISSFGIHETHSAAAIQHAQVKLDTADVVVAQVASSGRFPAVFSSDGLQAARRRGATVITFPSIYHKGQHPTLTQFRVAGKALDTPAFVYHEGLVAHLVRRGRSDPEIVTLLSSPDAMRPEFVQRHRQASLAELRARESEAALDIRVSNLIDRFETREQLFHTFNHPSRRLIVAVANAVLARLGLPVRAELPGSDYLSFPRHPILPAVRRQLGLDSEDNDLRFHWASKSLDFEAYIALQAKRFRAIDPDLLERAFADTPNWPAVIADWQTTHPEIA